MEGAPTEQAPFIRGHFTPQKNGGDQVADSCTALGRWCTWMMLVCWAQTLSSGSRNGKASAATSKASLLVSCPSVHVLWWAFDPHSNRCRQDICYLPTILMDRWCLCASEITAWTKWEPISRASALGPPLSRIWLSVWSQKPNSDL